MQARPDKRTLCKSATQGRHLVSNIFHYTPDFQAKDHTWDFHHFLQNIALFIESYK